MPPKGSSAAANRRKSGKATPANTTSTTTSKSGKATPANTTSTTTSKSGKATPANTTSTTTSNGAAHSLVTLKVNPDKLRAIVDPSSVKAEPSPSKESPATSTTIAGAPATNGTENPSENPSNTGTPIATGTPTPSQPIPAAPGTPAADQLPKKKGVKRGATNGEPRQRGKPGPKKKARLEDGSIDPNAPRPSHKLGPKANQGAINAGLRALDRSGKPTRRWTKTTFKLKSFTGEQWELSRWRTNPKPKPEEVAKEASATASAESSNKENKGNASQPGKSDKSPSTADIEMKDVPVSATAASPAAAPTGTSTPAPLGPTPVTAS